MTSDPAAAKWAGAVDDTAMWRWAHDQAMAAPPWSDERWRLVNAILDIRLHDELAGRHRGDWQTAASADHVGHSAA